MISIYGNIRYVHENQIKNSNLKDIHHNPKPILLSVTPKTILKKDNDVPIIEINSDDESSSRVKVYKSNSKQRSLSFSDAVPNITSRPQRIREKPIRYRKN